MRRKLPARAPPPPRLPRSAPAEHSGRPDLTLRPPAGRIAVAAPQRLQLPLVLRLELGDLLAQRADVRVPLGELSQKRIELRLRVLKLRQRVSGEPIRGSKATAQRPLLAASSAPSFSCWPARRAAKRPPTSAVRAFRAASISFCRRVK